ncbi:cofactor-independent phosphoglycerate mutase [Geoglobus acetivorans]|uniref:phosphoglycerate mutase (2,3-diphosphoglycerate-independent) n=1 Tax=Geoglobus acetivorans TaxID=565033 RepID=A0ABZ3H459_GEOAI|nr:cofactor-independent phosphoglycerate mutase [Geoglobus acetivorans]
MKHLILIPDGLADWEVESLGHKTPLDYADPENMNYLAREGVCGVAKTIPDGFEPGSDIANMTILGVDPRRYYTGRGPIEAVAMGVEGRTFFRCNLVYVENGVMVDYSGNRIGDEEARRAFETLNKECEYDFVSFHHGVSFRGILALHKDFDEIPKTYPPHDIMGERYEKYLPSNGHLARLLNELMEWSVEVLAEIGSRANMIWPWSGGKRPEFPEFVEKYGLRGAMISEVDLLKGVGKAMGMEVIDVPGVTAYVDTNYRGLARATLKALKSHDVVVLHTEGIDEVGHEGEAEKKVEAIMMYDEKIVGYLLDRLDLDETKIMLIPDHPTPVKLRTHVAEEVPFVIRDGKRDDVSRFTEKECKRGKLGRVDGLRLMEILIGI